jgi:hypothetical protein
VDSGGIGRRGQEQGRLGERLGRISVFVHFNPMHAPFPLTPTLSPGEREPLPRCLHNRKRWKFERLSTILPLPEGEGGGEGKGAFGWTMLQKLRCARATKTAGRHRQGLITLAERAAYKTLMLERKVLNHFLFSSGARLERSLELWPLVARR